mgnify:CR=1 FL=1
MGGFGVSVMGLQRLMYEHPFAFYIGASITIILLAVLLYLRIKWLKEGR